MKETYQPQHAAPEESQPADEEYTGRHEAPTTNTGDRIRNFGLNAAQASERVASFVDSKLLAGRERLERGKAILGNIGRGVLGLTVIAVEGAGKMGARGVESVKNGVKGQVGFSKDVVYGVLDFAKENVTGTAKKLATYLTVLVSGWPMAAKKSVARSIRVPSTFLTLRVPPKRRWRTSVNA